LLAIAAMFGAWALDLTLKDGLLIPAVNVSVPQQTIAPTPTATTRADLAASAVYVVKRGDTLRNVAQRLYHDESRWRLIYEANRQRVADPENLLIGTRLEIPDR
jgi:nucleoid-associated protein YgaU